MVDDIDGGAGLEALEERLRAALEGISGGIGAGGDASALADAEAALEAERASVVELTARIEELEAARTALQDAAAQRESDHRQAIVALTDKLKRLEAEATADTAPVARGDGSAELEDLRARLDHQTQLAVQLRNQRDRAKQTRIEMSRELDDLKAERAAEAAQLQDLLNDLAPALEGASSHA